MRIGLDVTRTTRQAGIDRVTDDLVVALSQYDRENEYVLFTNENTGDCRQNMPPNFRVVRARFFFKKYLWNQTELPRLLHKEQIDLFYSPHNCCAPNRYRGRVLVTIHDLIPLLHSLYRNRIEGWVYRHYLRQSVRRADHIITDAEYTRRLIAEHTAAKLNDISVVPLCVGPEFTPPKGEPGGDSPLHHLPEGFLLGYNSRQPLKNTTGLLAAYARYRRAGGKLPIALYGKGFSKEECYAVVPELTRADPLCVPGSVSDSDLLDLYGQARAFIFPTCYEGFGLPVLEAMACGCPVITANTTSVPEVAGNAAILVDPENTVELANAMAELVKDNRKLEDLRQLGMARARTFSRKRYAQNLRAVFEQVMSS